MREQPPHPFDFATHPRSLDRALRSGDLTETDYVILVRLYGVANRATWIATLTLEQLAESIAWERSLDWLYRRLADLKRRRWIDYLVQPSKNGQRYPIRLLYDRSEACSDDSEETPSTTEVVPALKARETASW